MMILSIFQEGGFGMWPTLIFGTVASSIAFRFAAKPPRGLPTALWPACAATLLAGILGFLTGTVRTFQWIQKLPPEEQYAVTLIGLSESMWNLVLAFVLLTVCTLLVLVGTLRRKDAGFA